MDRASPPDPGGEAAQILHALRHALADPLSAASLKLALVERRLLSPPGADPSWILERVRALQGDLGAAARLLNLLVRLAEIGGERPQEASLRDVCGRAGVPLDAPAASARLSLRAGVLADAIRSVAAFVAGPGVAGREELGNGRVTLTFEGSRGTAGGRPERLLDLPHGFAETETLFVARAAAAADGGRLELTERDGRIAAIFSWPLPAGDDVGRKGDA